MAKKKMEQGHVVKKWPDEELAREETGGHAHCHLLSTYCILGTVKRALCALTLSSQ